MNEHREQRTENRELLTSTSEELEPKRSSTTTLDSRAIEKAIQWLSDQYPHQPMSADLVDSWTEVLARMRFGELLPAVAACRKGRFRPDPVETLQAALDARPVVRYEEYRRPDWGQLASQEYNARAFAWCRAKLRGEDPGPAPWEAA